MTDTAAGDGRGTRRSRAARLGRPFPAYEPLEKFDARVEARLAVIREETGREPTEAEVKKVKAAEARRQRAAVAGFDLVFSPVKSAALLWAIDERALGPGRDPRRARGGADARRWTWSRSTRRSPGPGTAGSRRSRRTG